MYVTISNIALGDDEAVQAIIDSLIADFNDHPDLPGTLFSLGEEYYKKAYRLENEGHYEQAKEYFQKAIVALERIIREFPGSTHAGYSRPLITDCLNRFGDKYCGAYVVWHTLHHYGLTKPIDVIAKEMRIEKQGSVSIYEIAQTLKTNGISAHAVKLDFDKMSAINKPFIQYIASAKDGQPGHFRLCIPTGSGKAVILDGVEEPEVFDLTFSEKYDYQGTIWNGTSILIDGIRKDTSNESVSQLLYFNDMLLVAASWLGPHLSNSDLLTLDKQLSLRGGCPTDCKTYGKICYNRRACTDHDVCATYVGQRVCLEQDEDEGCNTPGSAPNCVVDSSVYCTPMESTLPHCDFTINYCKVSISFPSVQCDLDTSLPRLYLGQCHD